MKTIQMKIGDTLLTKHQPLVKDWFEQQKYYKMLLDKDIKSNKQALKIMTDLVGLYFGIDGDLLLKSDIKVEKILGCYKTIQENIIECFTDETISSKKNISINNAFSSSIGDKILDIAKTLFFNKGVLPDDFFNQSLKNFAAVIAFAGNKKDEVMNASDIDSTNY